MYLPPDSDVRWDLARQMGIGHAVARLPAATGTVAPWSRAGLVGLRERFADAQLTLEVIEPAPPFHEAVKLGGPDRERAVEQMCAFVQAMGEARIPILCFNFMAGIGWTRTSTNDRGRGGAFVTSFDRELMPDGSAGPFGTSCEDEMWERYAYFAERVVPVAASSRVKLALHPDDPPVSPLRGMSRIVRTVEAMERAIDIAPSPYHGVTLCQGTLSAMGADIPAAIRRFARRGALHFVHFRDVKGGPERFVETFHDEGQTDMAQAMRTYREVGFNGPLRPDHAPTMAGEANQVPGYQTLGRLFALGYIRGLMDATVHGSA
jgi:mannonate dehydratase